MNTSNSWPATFADILRVELKDLADTDLTEPDSAIQPSETVLGDMSEGCRRLYHLSAKYQKMALRLKAELFAPEKGVDVPAVEGRMSLAQDKAAAIRQLMWITLREDFGIPIDGLGVRKGWKVVRMVEGAGLGELLQRLGRGGL